MLPWVGMTLLLLLGSSSGSNSSRGHEELLQSFLHDLDINKDANNIEADAESDSTMELFYKPSQSNINQVKPLRFHSRRSKLDVSSSGEPVTRLWGVPDSTATVGMLFSVAVPKDAFAGDVQYYQLKGLPSWLHWDGHRHVVEGVAGPTDRGQHYITIKAVGADGTKAKDVFSVDVTDMSSEEISRQGGCSNKVDLTVASVIINKSLSAMNAKNRVRTLRAASKLLAVKKLFLTSVMQDLDPLANNAAILTGLGSSPKSGHMGMSQIDWVVGCRGDVSVRQQGTVERLKAAAEDGTLEQAINVPVLGWMIVQVHAKARRVRREVDYTGDYPLDYSNYEYVVDGDYENEDSDYDDEEYDEGDEVPTTTASPVYTSLAPVPISTPIYDPVKPTKVVAIEASPTVAQPSESVTMISPNRVIPQSVVTETDVKNFSPYVNVHIPKMTWIAGHVYRMVIPKNTFLDLEDGYTSDLELVFKNSDGMKISYSWIQFDANKQEIYALPLEANIGNYKFYLEAMDSEGKSKTDTIHIHVKEPKEAKDYNHIITTILSLTKKAYLEFKYHLDWQIKAVEKIAALYGDETTDHINVRSVSSSPDQISWTNVSLVDPRSQSCSEDELEDIVQVLVNDNVNMEPNSKAKKAFEPEFVIKTVKVDYLANCADYVKVNVGEEENDPLLNFIIPVLIIACLLLLAAIIACCLFRRRKYGKMDMTDDSTYVSKGIPIIFAEELDDLPDSPKTPIIMKNEKPPVPPPQYQRGSSPAASMRPNGDHQPPPPITPSNGTTHH